MHVPSGGRDPIIIFFDKAVDHTTLLPRSQLYVLEFPVQPQILNTQGPVTSESATAADYIQG